MNSKILETIEQLPGSYLDKCRTEARCPEDEALLIWVKGMIRLDDPVVTGLVDSLRKSISFHSVTPQHAEKALSAYEARVKEVSRE